MPKSIELDKKKKCRCYINAKYYAGQAKAGGNMKGYKPCPIHESEEKSGQEENKEMRERTNKEHDVFLRCLIRDMKISLRDRLRYHPRDDDIIILGEINEFTVPLSLP